MPATPDIPIVEQHIIELTNEFRAKHNQSPVKLNTLLTKAARRYAEYLARSKNFSHEADGRKPAERVELVGYQYCQVSENLASALDSRGFSSEVLALQTVEGWINSPGHRKNLLAPLVKEIGVAVARARSKYPKYVSVQLFGRPKSEMFTFQISNISPANITYSFGGETHNLKPNFAFSHSSCEPGSIDFLSAKKKNRVSKLKRRIAAQGGKIYTIRSNDSGGVRIDIKQKERLRPRTPRKTSAR